MQENKAKSRKWILIAVAVVVIAVIVAAATVLANRESSEDRVARLLDLGQQYLLDEKFEEAIAAFDGVLEIEPNHADAIEGEVTAYLGWSEALMADGDYDRAVEVLSEGYEKLGDERLQKALESMQSGETDETSPDEEPYQKLAEAINNIAHVRIFGHELKDYSSPRQAEEMLVSDSRYVSTDGINGRIGEWLIETDHDENILWASTAGTETVAQLSFDVWEDQVWIQYWPDRPGTFPEIEDENMLLGMPLDDFLGQFDMPDILTEMDDGQAALMEKYGLELHKQYRDNGDSEVIEIIVISSEQCRIFAEGGVITEIDIW